MESCTESPHCMCSFKNDGLHMFCPSKPPNVGWELKSAIEVIVGERSGSKSIEGELYYVRNGDINNYALTFNLPIKKGIRDIYFSWQNLRPPAVMLYDMGISVSAPAAMASPSASINPHGTVPTSPQGFRVSLPCTGQKTADVDVIITLNVTMHSASNITTLNIRRRKTCYEGEYGEYEDLNRNMEIVVPPNQNYSYTLTDDEPSAKGILSSSLTIIIGVGSIFALILLVVLVGTIYYCRSSKSPSSDRMRQYKRPLPGTYAPYLQKSDTSSSQALSHSGHTYLRAETPNNSVAAMSNLRARAFSPPTELTFSEVQDMLREIPIDRSQITIGDILMEGTFGRLYMGMLVTEDENEVTQQRDVFIKTVTDEARPDQIETMLRESCLLKNMSHPNINPIIGACFYEKEQPLLLFPYLAEGNLKKFLQHCKVSEISSHYTLSTQQLVYMATQIIRGLQYLHRKRIIHKDVAARNFVIDGQLVVKVADAALSRDLFPNEYNCLGDNENRPVKWLSLEALLDHKFLPAGDVWSFGVTLWELITLGQIPYADVDPFEMASYLRQGYRLSQPANCPDELFAVMACCWALAPDERPKFSQLLICLQDFYTALGRFI